MVGKPSVVRIEKRNVLAGSLGEGDVAARRRSVTPIVAAIVDAIVGMPASEVFNDALSRPGRSVFDDDQLPLTVFLPTNRLERGADVLLAAASRHHDRHQPWRHGTFKTDSAHTNDPP